MKTKISTEYRKFKSAEHRDSGYYSDLDENKQAKIEVDIEESSFEQVLTMFHEYGHHVFDFLCQYHPENKQITRRSTSLKNNWKNQVGTIREKGEIRKESKEEIICIKLERAIKKVLKKEIPKKFQKQFFNDLV